LVGVSPSGRSVHSVSERAVGSFPLWRTNVRISLLHVAPLSVLLLTGCSAQNREGSVRSNAAIESLETGLSGSSCAKEVDRNDPNETPYLVCPGVGGYTLIVRRVDAGRQSIDVVDPAKG